MATAQSCSAPLGHHMVFTIPRTASHLLLKLLNLPQQHSVYRHSNNQDGYMFLPAAALRFRQSLPGKAIQEWSEEEKTALKDAMQGSFDDWLGLIEEAEKQGKSTFVKEHLNWMASPAAEARLYGHQKSNSSTTTQFQVHWKTQQISDSRKQDNITYLPDAFLLQEVKPTFLIRHPALTFPSCLRTAMDNEGASSVIDGEKIQQWECTYFWSLSLYTFYIESAAEFDRRSFVDGVKYPIVLDAQDLGDEALVRKYAKAVGLDEEKVRFTWKAAEETELARLGKVEKRMKSTILASSGIEEGKLNAALDIEIQRLTKRSKA
ncbi:uncharacterized protein CC84DRAFT_1199247 [Paraphaeosphaeria sporulosa]|uniref:P-loop containing nucleoside triphosphate hydrolase protein n=1 Tax=Paraphaeosphaeria sporulosa TaxID=1460663 RepID=A0A177C059_9PLEO|nr:uncharacterized protein CC84DRAFT_1199247 [Paraphaeosphaeria sporulosa]OAG00279.1 hypothetical protein CC84DRAFT_1199247 [Paraphaeosphaeria sporulosa]